MYYFLLGLQGLTTIVVFVEFLYIFHHAYSRHRTILMLLTLAAWVNNAGYFVEIVSTTKEAALIGTKICYLGKSFMPLLILMFAVNYCGVRYSSAIYSALAFFHFAIWGLVLSCEHHKLFYTDIGFTDEGIFPHLVLGHGPAYYVFIGAGVVYFCVAGVYLIRKYLSERSTHRKHQILGMFATLLIAAAGLGFVLAGITRGYDTTAVAYAVASLLLLWGMTRYDFLDMVVEAKEYSMNQLSDGLIILDEEYQVLYRNKLGTELVPEMSKEVFGQEYLFKEDKVYKPERQEMQPKKGRKIYLCLFKDVTDSYHYEEHLEHEVAIQTSKLEERGRKMEQMSIQVVRALADTIDAKDKYTKGHSTRVARYAVRLAKELGYSEEELSNLRNVALLHDIGKVSVPDSVLNKPDKLTDIEYEVIKSHAAVGGDILSNISVLPGLKEAARYHHERYDGKGYPEGLKGEEIPEIARIVCIADAYDAMSSRRVYRNSLSSEKIREELVKGKGTQFDPDFTEVFLRLFDEGKLQEEDSTIERIDAEQAQNVLREIMKSVKEEKVTERDTLTGLMLRYEGEKAIGDAMQDMIGCLCVIDVDDLKKLNDRKGYLAGDHVLKEIGDLLKQYEESSILCRSGGDEFQMFILGADKTQAEEIVNELLENFEKKKRDDELLQEVSLSVGICSCRKQDTFSSVQKRAEKALYYVKQNGKSGYYTYQRKSERANEISKVDMDRLIQRLKNSGNYQGALDVEYPLFTKLYKYIKNLEKRYGYEFNLALVTLEPRTAVRVDEQEKAMACMEQAIRSTIRSTDICSRYSGLQFLVVFANIGENNIRPVMSRIIENYLKHYHGEMMEASYEVADMKFAEENSKN